MSQEESGMATAATFQLTLTLDTLLPRVLPFFAESKIYNDLGLDEVKARELIETVVVSFVVQNCGPLIGPVFFPSHNQLAMLLGAACDARGPRHYEEALRHFGRGAEVVGWSKREARHMAMLAREFTVAAARLAPFVARMEIEAGIAIEAQLGEGHRADASLKVGDA